MSVQDQYKALSLNTSGYFECQLPVMNETEKAIQFDAYAGHLDHSKGVWMPKSQMHILDMGKEGGTRYFIKNWLYSKLK